MATITKHHADNYYPSTTFEMPAIDQVKDVESKLHYLFAATNGQVADFEMLPMPSASCGDIVELDGVSYYCAPIGWAIVEDQEALAEFLTLDSRDKCFFTPFWSQDGKGQRTLASKRDHEFETVGE